jgi:hypothetical protein
MVCRRVLSSTPLLVRGSETGGDSGDDAYMNLKLQRVNIVTNEQSQNLVRR